MDFSMEELEQLCVDEGASDLHIRVGIPPMLRIHGSLTPLDCDPLTPEDTFALMESLTNEEERAEVDAFFKGLCQTARGPAR